MHWRTVQSHATTPTRRLLPQRGRICLHCWQSAVFKHTPSCHCDPAPPSAVRSEGGNERRAKRQVRTCKQEESAGIHHKQSVVQSAEHMLKVQVSHIKRWPTPWRHLPSRYCLPRSPQRTLPTSLSKHTPIGGGQRRQGDGRPPRHAREETKESERQQMVQAVQNTGGPCQEDHFWRARFVFSLTLSRTDTKKI